MSQSWRLIPMIQANGAQQMAIDIDQCATRVARVDRRIGLDEVLEGVDAEVIAAQR